MNRQAGYKLIISLALLATLATFRPSTVAADDTNEHYSPVFFGLSTELSILPGQDNGFLNGAEVESVCLTAAIGHRDIFAYPKLRVRGGFGFWPGRAFLLKAGLELPAFEFLSSTHGRLFGLYLYLDGIARLSSDGLTASAEASGRLLIPLGPIGGLAVGCGYDTAFGLVFHVDYLAGFYAIN